METEELISEPLEFIEIIDHRDLPRGDDLFHPKVTPYQDSSPSRQHSGHRRPAGTPEPYVYICKDPAKCPPPHYGPPRIPYGPAPGLHICRDPNNCPHPTRYGPPPSRPYRIRPRPVKIEDDAPRYTPEATTPRPVKKYGYHPVRSNPTIYRQEVTKMNSPEPETVEEVDIENMTMEELKDFIAAAEAEKPGLAALPGEQAAPTRSQEEHKMEMVEKLLSGMDVRELVTFVKASTVLDAGIPNLDFSQIQDMTKPELQMVIKDSVELPMVLKQVTETDVRKMNKETLKEVVEEILEEKKEEITEMTKVELKDIVMEAVLESPANKPEMLMFLDQQDVSKMTKSTLKKIAEEVVENSIDHIEEKSKNELKEMVMEVAVVEQELIAVPVDEADIIDMTLEELKEFVAETTETVEEKPLLVVDENDVAQMTMEELKEFIQEAEEEETLLTSTPIEEVDIHNMSQQDLKDFVMNAVIETKLLEPIVIPIREADLVEMSKEGLKQLIMETPDLVNKVIEQEDASDEKKMTMKKVIEMRKKLKNEKPVKMLIKGGVLFKDGMTPEEIKADSMGLTVKEMVTVTEGLSNREMTSMEDGISVEEMIAIENDVTVEEMVAMKNDLTVAEVVLIKDTMTVEEILEEKPEISVAEVIALKKDMSVEEMVAMKNDVPVLEIMEVKDKLTMNEIMSLQDGITKGDLIALTDEKMTIEEIIEEKEETVQLGTTRPSVIAEEPFSNSGSFESMPAREEFQEFRNTGSGVIDIEENNDQGVQFQEVFESPEIRTTAAPEILESIRNTNFPDSDVSMMKEIKENSKKPGHGIKMRPMRVKVRKPMKQSTTQAPSVVESHLSFGEMESLMEQAFGMKDFPMTSFVQTQDSQGEQGEVTHEDLVLEPTPAVPGRPVTFQDFLPHTTPATVSVESLKTPDFQREQEDFPIYDTEERQEVTPRPHSLPPLKDSEFPPMPIFTNFPMMQPGEFVQMEQEQLEEQGQSLQFFGHTDSNNNDIKNNNNNINIKNNNNNVINLNNNNNKNNVINLNNNNNAEYEEGEEIPSFTAFSDMQVAPVFDLIDRPDSRAVLPPLTPPKDSLASLVTMVTEHEVIPEEVRLFRSPQSKGHPHHRYGGVRLGTPTPRHTPFTVRSPTVRGGSYMQSSYRHRLRQDAGDTAMLRELPEEPQREVTTKPLKKRLRPAFKSKQKIKPFVAFGEGKNKIQNKNGEEGDFTLDSGDVSLKGLDFYGQYGQHDDRPPITRKKDVVEEEEEEEEEESNTPRPGEIRFGGMSFALPPPGTFPDRPEEEEESVGEVYPGHPVSQVFPNRPVSQVFRDMPEPQKLKPKSSTSYSSSGSGIRIEDTGDIEVPSFENFFKDSGSYLRNRETDSSYLRNPFGEDFIKLEIDQKNFHTNKSKPGVHHIPLDVHGFPDVPTYKPQEETERENPDKRRKRRPVSSSSSSPYSSTSKPPYKPPPVITRYEPPTDSKSYNYNSQHFAQSKASLNEQPESSGHSWKGGIFQEAMTNIPNAMRHIPSIMERLMGSHADWVQRAWNGRERDESAAA